MTKPLALFLQQVAAMAGQIPGSPPVLIVVRDPVDRTVSFVGTAGALDNMRPEIRVKVGVEANSEDTAWPSD